MSAASDLQVIDPQEFTSLDDYQFTGNDVTISNKRTFIEQLRLRAAVYVAAKHTGINKLTAYRWRDADSQFAEAWEEALQDAADVMESSVYERALNGDNLLSMFWLKAHRHQYRDKVTVDIQAVNEEIAERMKQVKQLPDTLPENLQIASRLDELQKEAQSLAPAPAPTNDHSS